MSELGIYEGCYVKLRNGDVVGPVNFHSNPAFVYGDTSKVKSRHWAKLTAQAIGTKLHNSEDIIRVLTKLETAQHLQPLELPKAAVQATIPPHVITAAMDAGIKAKPVYEQFVNAILKAGFQAQYGIEFVGRSGQPEVKPVPRHVIYNALDAAITGPKNGDSRREGTAGERLQ